ncbi:MAG: hypothetical protein AAFR49_18135 [Pseudomonadota bacterium]
MLDSLRQLATGIFQISTSQDHRIEPDHPLALAAKRWRDTGEPGSSIERWLFSRVGPRVSQVENETLIEYAVRTNMPAKRLATLLVQYQALENETGGPVGERPDPVIDGETGRFAGNHPPYPDFGKFHPQTPAKGKPSRSP